MKTNRSHKRQRARHGFLEVDMVVAMAILALALVPLGYSFARERQVLRIEYYHSVINEIVDGEMEILADGAASHFPDGTQTYTVHARAAVNLPPGHFQLTKNGDHLCLAWLPDAKSGVSAVVRETTIK